MTGQMPDIIEKISAARDTFFRTNGFMPNTIKMSMADYRATLELGDPNINVGMRIVKRGGEMECAFEPSSDVSKPDKPIVMKRDFSSCIHGIPAINCTECFVAPKIDLRDAIKRDDPTGEYGTCVHGNDFMTCAKCIPPIANKESVDKEIDLAKKFCKAEYDAAPKELDPGILPYPKPIIERKKFAGGEENIKIPMLKNLTGAGSYDTIKISMVNITPLAEWFRNQTAKEFEKLRFKFEQRMPDIGECGLVMIDNQTLFVTRTSHNYFHSYGNPSSGSTQVLIERAKEAVTDAVTLVRIDPSIEGDESVDQSANLLKTGFRF